MTSIVGGIVLGPAGPTVEPVHIANGRLTRPTLDEQLVHVIGHTIAPGFIDIQVNGGWGHDFSSDPSSIWAVGVRLLATGVTSFLPTIVSSPPESYHRAISVLKAGPPPGYGGAVALGLHFEGPWISPEWPGAHNPEHLTLPDTEVALTWAKSGVVSMVTMAPELPGAQECASVLTEAGILVSAGHTGADYEAGTRALGGHWSAVTHLFNQMTPFHPRSPGMVGAALTSAAPCGLIVDGIHSDPAAVQLAWSQLGPERMLLVTDSMAATGLDHGTYRLGDLEVTVGPDGPHTNDGRLAGSTLTMDRAVSNLVGWTCAGLPEAVIAASTTPASLLGLEDRGRIEPGLRGDLVVLDQENRVVMTLLAGEVAYQRPGDRA